MFGKKSKYNAIPTVIDGIRFASKKEAKRYEQLKILLQEGKIHSLEMQPTFLMKIVDHLGIMQIVGRYRADFMYVLTKSGETVVEDVKGYKKGPAYTTFRNKKKHVEAQYGIKIVEI